MADEISGRSTPTTSRRSSSTTVTVGLTEADLAAIEDQGAEIAALDGVVDDLAVTPGVNPGFLSQDGDVAYTYFTFNFGKDGWNKLEDPVTDLKDLTAIDGVDVHIGGYGGQAYDFISSFGDSHITLLLMTFGVVILILLFTYRSPILWILPIISAGHRQHHGRRRGLPDGQVRRARGQRPEPVHPQHPGHRRRHRLRAAARRPLPRGAAHARGPARGDGVRAAPCRTGDHRQRRHRRRRPDVPGLRRPQLDREPRPGPRGRRRDHAPRDGHPAAGAAGHLRPLDLLAEAAVVRLARADRHRSLGPRGRPDQGPPASGLGRYRPAAGGRLPRPGPTRRRTACPPRTRSPTRSTRSRPRSCSSSTTSSTTPTRCRWSPTPTGWRRPRRPSRASTGSASRWSPARSRAAGRCSRSR